MLDIFRQDAFGIVPLSIFINNLKFVPGFVSSMGIFAESGQAALTVAIEEKNNVLTIISPSARGGPGQTMTRERRGLRMLSVPHFQVDDAVMAEEVQGVRAFGTEDTVETVMGKLGERLQVIGQSLEYTKEYARVGAVKGIVTYGNGQTLNLYNEYGIAVPATIDFNLGVDGSATGAFRKKCAALYRTIGANLDGVPWTGVTALCGDNFFDNLIGNPEVRTTYMNYQAAAELRGGYIANGQVWGQFEFGGIRWINYRGNVGGSPMIETDLAYFFPTGTPDLFKTIFAPADYVETVNTVGVERYVKQKLMHNEKGIDVWVQTNQLNFCTRPLALQRGTWN